MKTMKLIGLFCLFLFMATVAYAQAGGGATGPATSVRFGTSLPSVCQPTGANVFFKSDTGNFYVCGAANTWSLIGGAGSPSVVGSGTTGTIPKFTAASTLGDSVISESAGTITLTGGLIVGAGNSFVFNSRSRFNSPSDGQITMLNNASTGFTQLNLGGTTSSFPAIVRNGTAVDIKLADNSGFGPLNSGLTSVGGIGSLYSTSVFTVKCASNVGSNFCVSVLNNSGSPVFHIFDDGHLQPPTLFVNSTGYSTSKFTVMGGTSTDTFNQTWLDSGGNPVAYVYDTGKAFFKDTTITGLINITGDIQLAKTITAGGTTGAQTINKTTGSVNFAATATSLVVTNSLVTTSSIIHCTVATNDSAFKSAQCVAGSGSFTIFANAAANAETRVNFTVTN